jgi:hypothetical protein
MSVKGCLDVPEVLAELAAKEWEALEVIKGDLCEWLASILHLAVTPDNFLNTLESGVEICKLAGLIQQAATQGKEKGVVFSFSVPMEPLNYNTHAGVTNSSFYARDNVSNFISWCRSLGVQEAIMFESEGLVLHKDEKRVILCLLDVARFAEKVGIRPPQLVRMEREIEELERLGNTCAVPESSSTNVLTTAQGGVEKPSLGFNHHSTYCTLQSFPPKPDPSNFKRRHVSRIPIRRSHRLVGKTPSTCTDIPVVQKSRKRARSLDKEEAKEEASPSQKRSRVEDGGSGRRERAVKSERRGPGRDGWERRLKRRTAEGVKEKMETKGKGELVGGMVMETLDEGVMRKMAECTCQNKIEVTNCGNGKFLVKGASGRVMTTYARVSYRLRVIVISQRVETIVIVLSA